VKDTTDLKSGGGGTYVYLCTMKKKLSAITAGFNTINEIRVQYGNKSCGILKLVQSDDTEPKIDLSDGSQIYLCAGNNPDSKNFAVTNIQIKTTTANSTTPSGNNVYETILQNLGLDNGTAKYLYLTRNNKAPRKVLIKNYKVSKYEKDEMVLPTLVDGITAMGSTVVKKITNTVTNEVTKSSSFEFGIAVGVEATLGSEDVKMEFTVAIKANYNYASESTKSENKAVTNSQEVTCAALPKKTVKCMITKSTQRIISTYTYDQEFIGYDGTVLATQVITGTSENKKSSSLSISTCCYSGCCEGDATLDAGKSQCFDDKKNVRAKDLKCSAYDACQKTVKDTFNSSVAAASVSLSTAATRTRFFR